MGKRPNFEQIGALARTIYQHSDICLSVALPRVTMGDLCQLHLLYLFYGSEFIVVDDPE